MSKKRVPRRAVLKGALLGVAAASGRRIGRTRGSGSAKVDVSDPQAKSLGYVEDATKVDAKANPNYKAGRLARTACRARARLATRTFPATSSRASWSTRRAGARSGSSGPEARPRSMRRRRGRGGRAVFVSAPHAT